MRIESSKPVFTRDEILDSWYAATILFQFILPAVVTAVVSGLKISGLFHVLIPLPWIYILLPMIVSLSVGAAVIALILLIKLFYHAFNKGPHDAI